MEALLADVVVIIHLLFILFVIFGGLLLLWNAKIVFLHIPAIVWGVLIEFNGWICPLTPLENYLRYSGGGAVYEGGFVENYILPVIYLPFLTRNLQIILGILVITINVIVYWIVFRRRRQKQ